MRAIVSVVDDDPGIRDSMSSLFSSVGMDVVCYESATEFLAASDTMQPGCVLLDLRIPDMSGLEVQRQFSERGCAKPIVFLTGHADVEVSVRAMHQGAAEFLTKPVSNELLLDTVRAAIERSEREQAAYRRRAAIRARIALLSPREVQVMECVVEGLANKQTAHLLGISPKTVELHRSNMMAKMHAGSLAELVRLRLQIDSS